MLRKNKQKNEVLCIFHQKWTKNNDKYLLLLLLKKIFQKNSTLRKEHSYLPEALNTDNVVLLFVTTNIGALCTVIGRIALASVGV